MAPSFSSRTGLLLVAVAAAAFGGLATTGWAADPDNCLLCHQYRGLGRYEADSDEVHLYFVSPSYQAMRLGAHARIACTDCHERSEVEVIPHKPTTPVNCTQTCHLSDVAGLDRRFSHADVPDMLRRSVHNPDTLAELEFSHGPLLDEGQSYCLYCHDEPQFRDPHNVIPTVHSLGAETFQRCDGCHAEKIPLDTAYYLRHVASRLQPQRPPLETAQLCSVCHSDPLIREQFEMTDASVGYTGSYHGKAALLGEENTANCTSCHVRIGEDAHLVRSQDNPESITHVSNKANSCRSTNCHPGATPALGQAAVHFDITDKGSWELGLAIFFVIFTMFTFGPSLVLTILEFFQLVVGRHREDEAAMRALTVKVLHHPQGRKKLRRFTKSQRWQHWILALLFGTLVLTGFPMKFADQTWARYTIETLGGLGVAKGIHHWAGIALVVGFLTHLASVMLSAMRHAMSKDENGRRVGPLKALMSLPMFVGPKDLLKANQLLAYLLFLRKKPPTFGRFSLDQKFEYLGVFWGTMLLGVTGLMLWNEVFSTQFVSGRLLNLALIAHTYEAFLAVIHVGILHLCHVTIAPDVFPFSPATLSGQTPVTRLAEVHGEQVIEAARDLGIPVPPEVSHV